MTTKRDNKHRQVYLWEVSPTDGIENMKPYGKGLIKFSAPITKVELASILQKIGDENETKDIYFAFRIGGTIWRVYKTGEEEKEFDALFQNA